MSTVGGCAVVLVRAAEGEEGGKRVIELQACRRVGLGG